MQATRKEVFVTSAVGDFRKLVQTLRAALDRNHYHVTLEPFSRNAKRPIFAGRLDFDCDDFTYHSIISILARRFTSVTNELHRQWRIPQQQQSDPGSLYTTGAELSGGNRKDVR